MAGDLLQKFNHQSVVNNFYALFTTGLDREKWLFTLQGISKHKSISIQNDPKQINHTVVRG